MFFFILVQLYGLFCRYGFFTCLKANLISEKAVETLSFFLYINDIKFEYFF